MKVFKDYISEAIYPDSYLKNKKLMDLVKSYKDPFKFLLAVIDQMNRGKLNLKRIGAASTREVAALWNDFNDKKIPASMVEEVEHLLVEAKYPPRVKGWGNVKTGKLVLTPIKGKFRPYHQEFASKNLSKFGLKEKDAIAYIDDSYGPPEEDDSKKLFQDIQSGKIDRDNAFEEFLNNNGWHSIVIDDGTSSIGDYKGNLRKYHKIAVAIHKKYGDSMFQSAGDYFEVGTTDIHNKYDWNTYIKTKKIGGGRTEIGTTMAMFRGEERMKSFIEFINEQASVELDGCSCGCNNCDDITEAEYEGRTVQLNNPFRLPQGSKKKFGVYVKNDKGNIVKVTFGDPNMEIKRDDPARLKAFRSRHSCDDDPGPKWKARYWSCYQWRAGAKVDN